MPAQIDPIVGRYVHVTLQGRPHRLYFEEAGADSAGVPAHRRRRWTPVPAPDDGQRDHRRLPRLTFDLPWHGKSTPPDGWENQDYRLTTATYTEAIRTFCAALELERPVVLGCSIGGRIVLSLAAHHAAEFRALIGLESAAFRGPGTISTGSTGRTCTARSAPGWCPG